MAGGNIILIVDDAEVTRETLAELFGDEFIILQAENGVQAMKILRGHRRNLAAVFLDLVMPKMNGYEVLSEMKNQNLLFEIPVIIVTGMADPSEKDSLIRKGASDVLFKPINPKMVMDSLNKVMEAKNYRKKLESSVKVSAEVPKAVKYENIMDAVMSIMKHPNMEKPAHMLRVSEYSRLILKEYAKLDKKARLNQDKINNMSEAALLHDVGKLVISTKILNKKGAMTEEEMAVMKTHCIQGCNIISIFSQSDKNEFIKYTYNICRFHHEHWDGTGYPSGVKEDAIPVCAQAVALTTELDFYTAGGTDFSDRNVEAVYVSKGTKYSEKMIKALENTLEEIKNTAKKINAMEDMDAYNEVTRRLIDTFEIKEYANTDNVAENYNSMMALLDATVFELDTITGKFRRIYTTFSDFTAVPMSGEFGVDFIDLIQMDIKEEFRDEVLSYLFRAISGNIKVSVVPVSVTCQIYNNFHGGYQWYRISTVNMSWNPKTNNKTLLVIKNVDREIYVQSEINRISTKAKRIARDVIKYKDENEALKATAQYDRLTGLFNRSAAAFEIEERIIEYPDSLHGLMLINIDYFKSINDKYGHRQGDKALKEIGEIIQKQFRNCDVVGRMGADEYVAFMVDIPDMDVLTIKADNIISTINKLKTESGVYSEITVSIGIAYYSKDGKTCEDLFQKADAALFEAKKNGKG
ncbi:MAG: diguanylate cyclase, partial [Lachnospiraceae bacterium]|nr:diguanylate cyclase [Lachnospiraceae bacterium]